MTVMRWIISQTQMILVIMTNRLFQVLVLRELAVSAPTFFFQQVQPFFDNIFYAVWDPKQAIREGAVSALRACLILTTQRETKEMQKPQWYKARQLICGGTRHLSKPLAKPQHAFLSPANL